MSKKTDVLTDEEKIHRVIIEVIDRHFDKLEHSVSRLEHSARTTHAELSDDLRSIKKRVQACESVPTREPLERPSTYRTFGIGHTISGPIRVIRSGQSR